MKNSKRARLQWVVTRLAKRKGWAPRLRSGEMLSLNECDRLIKLHDEPGYTAAGKKYFDGKGKIGRNMIGEFLADYCRLKGLEKKTNTVETWPARPLPAAANPASDAFLQTYEWRRVRMQVLKRDGAMCACCGASRDTGAVMHVDHIKPRKLFPHLALDLGNLQVLCHECNHGKGNWDMTDWRKVDSVPDPADEFKERFC